MLESLPQGMLETGLALAGLFAVSWLVLVLSRWTLLRVIRKLARSSQATWDDALVEARVFSRLAHLVPALVVYYGIQLIPDVPESVDLLIQRVALALMVVVVASSSSAFLSAINEIYSQNPEYRRRPIKGYLQVVKIVVTLLTALLVLSILLDRSPWIFLSGIGALAAVLLLVFRDTILSLVASVQIASNDMIHVGDWIEMPQAGADGDVIDVALHTVKVQNWDKTISTIPTHKFIDESFKNWRGMSLSGGRRIKRSVSIDVNSVRFLTAEEEARFEDWSLLREYVAGKRAEIEAWNSQPNRDASINANIRRLTNIGTFRAYVLEYLRSHPKIHDSGYTLIVRQLAPSASGLPIELYCFTNDQAWDRYEGIQGDIFDHIIAMVPEFGLRVFQAPSGADFERLHVGFGAEAGRADS